MNELEKVLEDITSLDMNIGINTKGYLVGMLRGLVGVEERVKCSVHNGTHLSEKINTEMGIAIDVFQSCDHIVQYTQKSNAVTSSIINSKRYYA